ncbi:unnamed protein product [Amoebophrya sp. A25]|nr:unnamed protein product [Amoebophrya sp. A25]|eukprot:GSA25T00008804001.1
MGNICCPGSDEGRGGGGGAGGGGSSGNTMWLVFSANDMGTLNMYYSAPPGGSTIVAKVSLSSSVPDFKKSNNGGKQELAKGCGDKKKFFTTYMNFLKQTWQYAPTGIELPSQAANHSTKIKFLTKGSNAISTCTGRYMSLSSGSIGAVAVIDMDNNALDAGTMEHKLFVQKAMNEGAGEGF